MMLLTEHESNVAACTIRRSHDSTDVTAPQDDVTGEGPFIAAAVTDEYLAGHFPQPDRSHGRYRGTIARRSLRSQEREPAPDPARRARRPTGARSRKW